MCKLQFLQKDAWVDATLLELLCGHLFTKSELAFPALGEKCLEDFTLEAQLVEHFRETLPFNILRHVVGHLIPLKRLTRVFVHILKKALVAANGMGFAQHKVVDPNLAVFKLYA